MRTTIDPAGRIVVPKALRDAMHLTAGREIDISYADGLLVIEVVPADVEVHRGTGDELPVLTAKEDLPVLASSTVRDTLESTRR